MQNVTIPTLYPVTQALPKGEPVDIAQTLAAQWEQLGACATSFRQTYRARLWQPRCRQNRYHRQELSGPGKGIGR